MELPPDGESDAPIEGALLRVLLIASFGALLLNLSSTTINVAIDRLMVDLNAPLSVMQWIVTGYLLALTLVLPSFRWAVERWGSRRLYVACLLGFTATSMLCALAWSAASLIAFRVLQGAVGGLLAPLAQALIAQIAGPKRMGRAISIISIPVLVAPVLGPVLGGILIQQLSWRWLFLFNLPLGLVGAWLAHRRLPPGLASAGAPRARLDLVGFALLSPGIALFTYGVSAIGRAHGVLTARVALPLMVAVALIAIFVLDARRRPRSALLDLNLFKHRAVGAALVTYLLASFGSFGAQLVLPLYYQQVRGESPIHAGLLLAPQGLGMLLTLPQVGRLADRIDHGKLVMLGVVTTLAGTYAFTQVTEHSSYLLLSLALVVRGAGLGATTTPALAAAYRHLRRDEIPNATTALNVVQRLGAPLGTATMAVVLQRFAAHAGDSRALLARAFAHTFMVSAALSGLALFAAIGLIRANPPGKEPNMIPALLVMDFQSDIVVRIGDQAAPLLERAARVIAEARAAHLPIIYVVVNFRPGYPELSARNPSFATIAQTGRFIVAAPGSDIAPAVRPEAGDVIVVKHRVSAFAGTDLEMILRAKGIDTLVLLGISTSGVILSTVRHAADADYRLIVIKDGCADPDEEVHRVLTEKVLARQASVISAHEFAATLAKG